LVHDDVVVVVVVVVVVMMVVMMAEREGTKWKIHDKHPKSRRMKPGGRQTTSKRRTFY
jgi:hypothetical protein